MTLDQRIALLPLLVRESLALLLLPLLELRALLRITRLLTLLSVASLQGRTLLRMPGLNVGALLRKALLQLRVRLRWRCGALL